MFTVQRVNSCFSRVFPRTRTARRAVRVYSSAVKTTFDFGDNGDKEDKEFKRKKRFEKERAKLIDKLNTVFYKTCTLCCGNDLITWIEERWGDKYVASIEKAGDEMVLTIHPKVGEGETYCDEMDKIATFINDMLLMDYVRTAILEYRPSNTNFQKIMHGILGKELIVKPITISLNIHYDH